MQREQSYSLKPETRSLLERAGLVLAACYALAVALYCLAGSTADYQQALIFSESMAMGLRTGFGLLCLGFLFMECK